MRNLLALLGLAVVVFLGVGYFRGWYDLSTQSNPSGRTSIQIDVDRNKIGQDTKAVGEKVHDLIDRGADRLQAGIKSK